MDIELKLYNFSRGKAPLQKGKVGLCPFALMVATPLFEVFEQRPVHSQECILVSSSVLVLLSLMIQLVHG